MRSLATHFVLAVPFASLACGMPVSVGHDAAPAPITHTNILFVIDDSASMADSQAAFVAAFPELVDRVTDANVHRAAAGEASLTYRIGITTTSIATTYDPGTGAVTQSDYVVPSGVDCASAHDIRHGDPYPGGTLVAVTGNDLLLDSGQLPREELVRQFSENALVGICGAGQEQGFEAARRALENTAALTEPGSRLVVVFISDEEDCSDPDGDLVLDLGVDRCAEEALRPDGGRLGRVDEYATFFQSLAARVRVLSAASIVEYAGAWHPGLCEDLDCVASCPVDSDPRLSPCFCGGQSAGSRYLQLAARTGGSPVVPVCNDGPSQLMDEIADAIVQEW